MVSCSSLLPIADTVGVTNLSDAYHGKELITNKELSEAECYKRGIVGGVQVAATTVAALDILAPEEGLINCFPAGTLVHTVDGLKPIEQVAVGDRVWAYDHRELRWASRDVVEVYTFEHQGTMATLRVRGETMRATGGHPFWVVRGEGLAHRPLPVKISAYETGSRQEGRWVQACDRRDGDEVLLRDKGVVPVEAVQLADVIETVYNFHVAELQNYAVGECGVLVHNTNDPVGAGPGRTVIEENAAARAADKLNGRQQGAYQRAIDELANDIPGQKDHALKGKDGLRSRDLTGSGKGRGAMRIIYRRNPDGSVTIVEIADTHK